MATKVENFGQSTEITVFHGSSEEDITYAKTLWQSAQLFPPMESRLVSSNIKQRLKVAPPGHQTQNIMHQMTEEPAELVNFLAKAANLQRADEAARLEKFSKLREEDLKLLQKHRKQRQEFTPKRKKEVVHIDTSKRKPTVPKDGAGDANSEFEEVKQSLKDIEQFEKQLGQVHTDSDSD